MLIQRETMLSEFWSGTWDFICSFYLPLFNYFFQHFCYFFKGSFFIVSLTFFIIALYPVKAVCSIITSCISILIDSFFAVSLFFCFFLSVLLLNRNKKNKFTQVSMFCFCSIPGLSSLIPSLWFLRRQKLSLADIRLAGVPVGALAECKLSLS